MIIPSALLTEIAVLQLRHERIKFLTRVPLFILFGVYDYSVTIIFFRSLSRELLP